MRILKQDTPYQKLRSFTSFQEFNTFIQVFKRIESVLLRDWYLIMQSMAL